MDTPHLYFGARHPAVAVAKAILTSQGFPAGTGEQFDEKMRDQLVAFQGSHNGPDGKPLKTIGVLGPKTWWALQNPSGDAQRGFMVPTGKPEIPATTEPRRDVLKAGLDLWRGGVKEIPDGANWGDGVTKILAHAGGPRPWCMHFISYAYKLGTGGYPLGKDHGHVLTFWQEAKRRGLAHEAGSGYTPRPGDCGVTLYRLPNGSLSGAGHIWQVLAVGPRSGRGRNYNYLGGNEGNRLKLGMRNTADESLFGWINLFADAASPGWVDVLPFQRDVTRAAEALAATR